MSLTSTRRAPLADELPEDLRKKLTLLEGDRKAYFESSQAAIQANREHILALKKENKTLSVKLKSLKTKHTDTHSVKTGPSPALQQKIHSAITKRNTLQHQCAQIEKRMAKLEDQLLELRLEEQGQKGDGGSAPVMQRLRTLENSLDKAELKHQEAQHIGKTYQQIIHKLEQDRLQFDNTIAALEKALKQRREDVVGLESMCTDACAARDHARELLAEKEQELMEARKQREAEKAELKALSEERRRQFEAMEKRIRIASASQKEEQEDPAQGEETKQKLETYEEAMQRIREATGVYDVDEVVERFRKQGDTQKHLQETQEANSSKLQELREEHARLLEQFEALKYSGEARNTSNQRMLSDFEARLTEAEKRCATARDSTERSEKTLVSLKAGVETLYEKLGSIKPVQFRAAANVQDKLAESELRLKKLYDELESRKSELPGGLEPDSIPSVLPEHNTRVALAPDDADASDSDSDYDDEFVSRDAMKKQAEALIDAKLNKKKRRSKKP
eukprot:m.356401 g.356401  ORF g.356401 m.356401 type:complete len:507 (+) comp17535_c0_seq1:264-1784(+)